MQVHTDDDSNAWLRTVALAAAAGTLVAALATAAVASASGAYERGRGCDGPHSPAYACDVDDLGFVPVARSNDAAATEPVLPPGFRKEIVVKPGDPTPDGSGYATNPDMNALDPAERYLFTSHEIFDPVWASASCSLTRTELETAATICLVYGHRAADGLKWTPWGTLLLGEEYAGGLVWEVDPWTGANQARPLLGTFAHEGMAVAGDGSVYLADENGRGAVYKFVPDRPFAPDALASGTLYAFKAGTGWIEIDDPARANQEAIAKGATLFNRPEDIEIDARGYVYVAITGEDRVIRLDDSGAVPAVTDFVAAGRNAPAADFRWPDNLAFDACGNLFILEDIPDSEKIATNQTDDVWVALPDEDGDGLADGVHRFAAWAPVGVEPSGAIFSRDGRKLYLNSLEGAANHRDGAVWVIEGFRGHGHGDSTPR